MPTAPGALVATLAGLPAGDDLCEALASAEPNALTRKAALELIYRLKGMV